jgi:glutathione synthase/RimK-type ligase-like ATP-grasp enzyme
LVQNYLGILVSPLLYRGIKRGKKLHSLSFYEEACLENNVIPCYFQLEDISIDKHQMEAYVKRDGKYLKVTIPRPMVIHYRGYHYSKSAKTKIKGLQKEGIVFFNEWNRYGKMRVYSILKENEEIKPHIPKTCIFNNENMLEMLDEYRELIIKPNRGSLGRNALKIVQLEKNKWVLHNPKNISAKEEVFSNNLWPEIFTSALSARYIIQERIPLAEYQGSPFDIRVSVQKNGDGEWQVTGMVGKVAKSGNFVTNVARGGTCYPLKEILVSLHHLDENQVYEDIKQLSIKIAKQLGESISNFADMGLDIGITEKGFPMFIECNARDLRYSFRNANLLTTWKATYSTPISYGKYLLNLRNNHNG